MRRGRWVRGDRGVHRAARWERGRRLDLAAHHTRRVPRARWHDGPCRRGRRRLHPRPHAIRARARRPGSGCRRRRPHSHRSDRDGARRFTVARPCARAGRRSRDPHANRRRCRRRRERGWSVGGHRHTRSVARHGELRAVCRGDREHGPRRDRAALRRSRRARRVRVGIPEGCWLRQRRTRRARTPGRRTVGDRLAR